MKRVISLFLLAAFILCGCAPSLEGEKKAELTQEQLLRTEGEYLDAAGKIIPLQEVTPDNWYKVQLTYPVDFVSESDLALYEEQYEKVSVDENNRVTVIMSRQQYESLKANAEAAIQADFDACTDGSLAQVLPNIAEIKSDELYSEVYVMINGDVNKEQITPFAYLLCKDLYRFKTLMANNAPTTIIIMDKETGAVYGEFNDVQLYEYEHKAEGGESDES